MAVETLTLPIQRTVDHVYYHEGVGYPGATGILQVLDKPALVTWAARQTAEAAVRLVDELAHMIATVGEAGTISALTDRSRWQRDEAAKLGSEVHRLAEQWVAAGDTARTMFDWSQITDGVRERTIAYADWWRASGWTKPLTEVIGVNPSVGYGGTFDLMAIDADGRRVLADIKTGGKVNRKAYETEVLQLQAYQDLTYIQVDGFLHPMPQCDRYVLLHVTTEGVREIEITLGNADRMAWLDCVDLYKWKQGRKGL